MSRIITKEQEERHIDSLKRLINLYREHARDKYVFVGDLSLKDLYEMAGVSMRFNPSIQEYLKENNYLSVLGTGRGISYKWVEAPFISDSYVLAQNIYQQVQQNLHKGKRSYTLHKRGEDVEKIREKEHTSAVKIIDVRLREYDVRETVVFLLNGEIQKGKVVGKFIHIDEQGEEEITYTPKFNQLFYRIWVSSQSVITLCQEAVFPSVELLLEALKIRFNKKS